MRRREFISGVGGAVVAWPRLTRAEQNTIPVVGMLRTTPANASAHLVEPFQRGLKDAGFVVGQNVAIEYHWAEGRLE